MAPITFMWNLTIIGEFLKHQFSSLKLHGLLKNNISNLSEYMYMAAFILKLFAEKYFDHWQQQWVSHKLNNL